MLKKSFSLASAVSLSGAVLWMSATSACSGDTVTPTATDGGSSSGDGAASSSGDSGNGGGTSSGSTGQIPTDAGLIDPNTVEGVAITYGKCDPFTKCEGSIAGSWDISGGCLPDTTFDEYKKTCPGLTPHDIVIKASGSINATDTVATQDTKIFVSAKIDVPALCAQFLGSCDAINGLLTSDQAPAKFDHAVCVKSDTGCACAADITVIEKSGDSYTATGGTLTTQSATKGERTYDYCPAGSKFTYHETTAKNPTFGMFLTVTKK